MLIRFILTRFVCFSACMTLTACSYSAASLSPSTRSNSAASTPSAATPIVSFYDYQLYDPSGKALSLNALPETLTQAEVILIGEWHTHSAIHRFQADFIKAMASQGRDTALSMEQFSRDAQPHLNAYLNGEIGEQTLITSGNAWPNYESDYRPLVELAKTFNWPVIAANAPKSTVRCVGRVGLSYLDRLSDDERRLVADKINTEDSAYKRKFMASMHHGEPAQTEKQYAAQMTWDETMAESIVQYLNDHPGHQVIHVAGKFHTEQGLGTKASILARNPNLSVVVITPMSDIASIIDAASEPQPLNTDYPLHVLAPPVRFVKMENQMAAFHKMSTRHGNNECQPTEAP